MQHNVPSKKIFQQIILHFKYFQEGIFFKPVVNMLSSGPFNKLRLHNATTQFYYYQCKFVGLSAGLGRLLSAVKLSYKDTEYPLANSFITIYFHRRHMVLLNCILCL